MQQRTFPQFAWPLFAQRRVFPYLLSWWSGWRRKLAAAYRFARSPAWLPCCRRSPAYGIPVPALPVRLLRFWRRCTAWLALFLGTALIGVDKAVKSLAVMVGVVGDGLGVKIGAAVVGLGNGNAAVFVDLLHHGTWLLQTTTAPTLGLLPYL